MMSAVRVSIVIPCFNHGAFLEEALRSVSAQTFAGHETIVVNDGSTDPATNRLLDRLADEGLKVMKTVNRGPAAARNFAISKARGEFILPLDADDRIAPRFLELAVAAMDADSEVRIVCGRVAFFGERSGEWIQPDYAPERILLDNMIVASSLFRRKDWQRSGGFSEDMRNGWEDWDFWLSLLADGGTVKRLDEVVFYYRIRTDSRDRTLGYRAKLGLLLKMLMRHKMFYLKHWSRLGRLLIKRLFRVESI